MLAGFVFALRQLHAVGRDPRIELRERVDFGRRVRDAPHGRGRRMQFEQRKQHVADAAKAVHLGERERRPVAAALQRDRMLRIARAAREHAFVPDPHVVEQPLAEFAGWDRRDVAHHEHRARLAAQPREQRVAVEKALVVERHHVGDFGGFGIDAAAADPFASIAGGHRAVDARAFDVRDVERHDFIEQLREARHEVRRADRLDQLAQRLERHVEAVVVAVEGVHVEQHAVPRVKSRRIVAFATKNVIRGKHRRLSCRPVRPGKHGLSPPEGGIPGQCK